MKLTPSAISSLVLTLSKMREEESDNYHSDLRATYKEDDEEMAHLLFDRALEHRSRYIALDSAINLLTTEDTLRAILYRKDNREEG